MKLRVRCRANHRFTCSLTSGRKSTERQQNARDASAGSPLNVHIQTTKSIVLKCVESLQLGVFGIICVFIDAFAQRQSACILISGIKAAGRRQAQDRLLLPVTATKGITRTGASPLQRRVLGATCIFPINVNPRFASIKLITDAKTTGFKVLSWKA